MSDRRLLEMAAKAAGIVGEWARIHQTYGDLWVEGLDTGGPIFWNPLVDDGDALRLAVKLRISLIHEQEYMGGPVLETLEATSQPDSGTGFRITSTECLNEIGGDEFAATRRAIVRAAAGIGEQMP